MTEFLKRITDDLRQRLGREPTPEEIQLEQDIRIIDSSGGKVHPTRGKHRKKKDD